MRNRILVLVVALASLLTTQCLLACSAAQQAAHACCPHKGMPDQSVDASVPVTPVSVELDNVNLVLSDLDEFSISLHNRAAFFIDGSAPPASPPGRITVLRL